jgi:hypothetical protein
MSIRNGRRAQEIKSEREKVRGKGGGEERERERERDLRPLEQGQAPRWSELD